MLKDLLKQVLGNRTGSPGSGERAEHTSRGSGTSMPDSLRQYENAESAMLEAARQYEAGNFELAKAIAGNLVQNDPTHHQAWNLLGALALATAQQELAVQHFKRAIALQPAHADYLSNCGEACRQAGRLDDAIEYCNAALAVDASDAATHYNLALALHAVGEIEQACTSITTALALEPGMPVPRSSMLFMFCHHPEFDGAALLAEHRLWDELHAREQVPAATPRAVELGYGRKLRVGYVSADFRRHALAYFVEPVFANYNRDDFEVICYSNTARVDEVTERLRNYTSQWRDITALSDEAAAKLVVQDGIDILVDLSGHSARSRLSIFARRPAPVQLTYLGYPNTTGLSAMDFRVSDNYMDPPWVSEALYSEKLLRMPHSLWCYRPPEYASEVGPLPMLESGVTTFGSPHSFTKLNRKVLELWARVLKRQPGSVLLAAGAPAGEAGPRMRETFAAHGIDPARIQLAGKMNHDEYMKMFHRIDMVLDTFPYNGGTTTCESLWMGVPVVTLAGKYGVARAGASLLTSVGMSEMVADSADRFVDIATEWARDPDRLAALRANLRKRMRQSPLMDEINFTRDFELLLRSALEARRQTA